MPNLHQEVRAFSLIESMIGLVITGLVVIAAIGFSKGLRLYFQKESEKVSVQNSKHLASQQIEIALDSALRVDGFTKARFAGIRRMPDNVPNSEEESCLGGLEVLSSYLPEFNLPATYLPSTQSIVAFRDEEMISTETRYTYGGQSRVEVETVEVNVGDQVIDFSTAFGGAYQGVTRRPFVALQTANNLDIIQVPTEAITLGDGVFAIDATALSSDFPDALNVLAQNNAGVVNELLQVKRTRFFIEREDGQSSGKLMLQLDQEPPVVLAKNISCFNPRFEFADIDNHAEVVLPETTLSHIDEPYSRLGVSCPNFIDGERDERCVDWSHIRKVSIQMVTEVPQNSELANSNFQNTMSGFRTDEDGNLIHEVNYDYYPTNFVASNSVTSALASNSCPAIRSNHCVAPEDNPDCATTFNSTDRDSPNWLGYKAGSPYCDCLASGSGADRSADGFDINANSGWRFHNFTGNASKSESCFAAFGCGAFRNRMHESVRRKRDLVCDCTWADRDPDSNEVTRMPYYQDAEGYTQIAKLVDTQSYSGPGSPPAEFGTEPIFSTGDANDSSAKCRDGGYGIESNGRSYCYNSLASVAGTDDPLGVDPWRKERCGCQTKHINSNGQPGNDMWGWRIDWSQLCNIDYLRGITDEPACGNTVQETPVGPNGRREFRPVAYNEIVNPNGLSSRQLEMCRCFDEADAAAQAAGDTATISVKRGDLRDYSDPSLAQYEDDGGNTVNVTFNGRPVPNRSFTANGNSSSCGYLQRTQSHGIGYCDRDHSNSSVVAGREAWSGYCDWRCDSASSGTSPVTSEEIRAVRCFAVGLIDNPEDADSSNCTNALLPSNCDGPSGGGGDGGGTGDYTGGIQ